MATSFQAYGSSTYVGSYEASADTYACAHSGFAGADDEECFNLDLDGDPANRYRQAAAPDLTQALRLLNGGTPDSVLEGLQLVDQNILTAAWREQFLAVDGASQCVELMGCFSALEVQQAAARVCTALARTGEDACMTLLDSDVSSMLQQHIKECEASLCMFENAALLLAALADGAGEAGHALTQLGLMAHLCGVLSFNDAAAAAARAAALSAITALCAAQPQAQANFFHYGGLNALLATLLQQGARSGSEILAAVTLLGRVLARMRDVRAIVADVRGIEVLAQVHRDAGARGDTTLQAATVSALAKLTFRHPQNLATLQSDAQLLGNTALYGEVVALHERTAPAPHMHPMSPDSAPLMQTFLSTSMFSDPDSPDSPHTGGVPLPAARKSSLDGSSARTLRRMSTSVRTMIGSVRNKIMRGSSDESAAAGSGFGSGTDPLGSNGSLV